MERLYNINPYLYEWETEIEEIIEKDGRFYVALRETAFYPEGGGQPADKGKIDGMDVIELVENGETIYHVLASKPSGKLVKCELDSNRRFDLMQQHTGQHLLSAVFYNNHKGETSSFHLGDDYISIDISLSDIPKSMIEEVERITNNYIYKNLEVKTHVVSPSEISKFPLRKLPPAAETIRIVEIDGIDYSPCCGTHVRRTGELGMIKILKTEKYKGITRVYFKCGYRALLDFDTKNDIILNTVRMLSIPENEIVPKVESSLAEIKTLNKQITDLKESLYDFEVENIVKNNESKVFSILFEDKNFNDVQLISRKLTQRGGYLCILASSIDLKVIFCHDGSFPVDCGKTYKEYLSSFNGRGGGSPKQAQAGFESLEDMKKFINKLENIIK